MVREHYRQAVIDTAGNLVPTFDVRILDADTDALLGESIFVDDTTATEHPNPWQVTTGVIDFYLDQPRRVHIGVTREGEAEVLFSDVHVGPVSALDLVPSDGDSAYQQAIDSGFEGSLEEWLDSLKADAAVFRLLSATESMSNSDVLTTVSDLALPIDVGQTWAVEVLLYAEADSSAPDMQVAVLGPTGATGAAHNVGFGVSGALGEALAAPLAGPAEPVLLKALVSADAVAGNIEVHWAQGTSGADEIRLLEGSYLKAEQVS